jgi:HD-GYP domain-containing protein (c-di-GMP phosphodiesterase class II)
MPGQRLIVIADEGADLVLPPRIAGLPVTTIDWQDIGRVADARDAHVLIDIDLRDIEKVRAVKDHLPRPAEKRCRVVAIERGSHQAEAQALALGASELLPRPLRLGQIERCLRARIDGDPSEAGLGIAEAPGGESIVAATRTLAATFQTLLDRHLLGWSEAVDAGEQVIDAVAKIGITSWVDTVRRYHAGTFQHCLLVTGAATVFGTGTGMGRSHVLTLTLAGLLHDIGKARIPLAILDKPAKLTTEEFDLIKQHPGFGHDYLRGQTNVSTPILDAVLHHHEYLDGSGYPHGLRGDEIEDLTRILTVCDVYAALTEKRPYKPPMSPADALKVLDEMTDDGKVEGALVHALGRCVAT